MKRIVPLFEVGYSYRMIIGFGWVQLARNATPHIGDQFVSTQTLADQLNTLAP